MTAANGPVRLIEAVDEKSFGGKCVSLGAALRAGLPAPDGFALPVSLVAAIAKPDTAITDGNGVASATERVKELFGEFAAAMAVRSSAVGEDSAEASFAGQHLTVLNIIDADAMLNAVIAVHDSAHTPEALAYRQKMEISGEPAIAVVLQRQILSDTAGVMFTRNPLNGAAERYIEASWGLGEAIVAGLVVPDSFRISSDGAIIERVAGEKDIKLVCSDAGETLELEVEELLIHELCLSDEQLQQLHGLAVKCEAVYGEETSDVGLDIEWAFHDGNLYLLQCRSITR